MLTALVKPPALPAVLLLALLLGSPVDGDGAASDGAPGTAKPAATVKELEALLQELRELRTHEEQERTAWAREKAELELLLSQRTARLGEITARRDAARSRLKTVTESLHEKTEDLAGLQGRTRRARQWMGAACETVSEALARNPLLGDAETRRRLADSVDPESLLSDSAARFWNVLLRIAALGVHAAVAAEEIELAGDVREVTVLRLGATGAVFLTRDKTRCGFAEIRDGALVWTVLPGTYREAIDLAIEVVRADVPATIVTVPFPRPPQGDRP